MPKSFNEVLHVGNCQELIELDRERNDIESRIESGKVS